jgi:NADH-quinone oxidoreductase subunit A
VVALIFLIFDVEVVLLLPWALVYQEYGVSGFMVGAIFLILLGLGMAYEWRKGDLEWARPKVTPPILSVKKMVSVETESPKEVTELVNN